MSLQKIQTELKAPKGQTNKFGGYRYRSTEDIVEAAKPILAKYGYSLVITDKIVPIGDPCVSAEMTPEGKIAQKTVMGRVYVEATASLYDGEMKLIASTTGLAREEDTKKGMDASQLTGATSSYARKYALNGLFAIDDTKDSDFTNQHK